MKQKDIGVAALFVILCEAVGLIGSVFTADSIPTWYASLVRPDFSPPNWLFAPVWTALYALMGVAAFLIWRKRNVRGAKTAFVLFGIQLALNAIWSPVFFGLHDIGAALVIIGLMWLAIAATIASMLKVSKTAAWLMVPYLAWVSFASYLNYTLYLLN
jgi:tryptophan-rich sensory protein